MAQTCESLAVVRLHQDGPIAGQRGMFAVKDIVPGDIVHLESPLVAVQHLWNQSFKYSACAHCMRSLEKATEMAQRLLGVDHEVQLRDTDQFDATDPSSHCECAACGELYCSSRCKEAAKAQYHATLCTGSCDPDEQAAHPLGLINAAWMKLHPPPESSSIQMVLRLLATVKQRIEASDEPNHATALSAATEDLRGFLGDGVGQSADTPQLALFQQRESELRTIHKMSQQLFPGDTLGEWRGWDKFAWLVAVMCTNAVGVSTSSLESYQASLQASMPAGAHPENSKLHTRIAQRVGPFTAVEGSAIYTSQSSINHSCVPNVIWKYDSADATLHVAAVKPIKAGEEITASYIDAGDQTAPRAERQRELLRYYLFNCTCEQCQLPDAVVAPAKHGTDPLVDLALRALVMGEAGMCAPVIELLPELLAKAAVKALDTRASEAASAMANFELVQTDQIGGYSFNNARSVAQLPHRLLLNAARHAGCVPLTVALLGKKHTKAYGCKQARRNAIGAAFVQACANGVSVQVQYLIQNWAEALEGDFAPLDLCCDVSQPKVAAWRQGLAVAVLNKQQAVVELVTSRFGVVCGELVYLIEDDFVKPSDYHDAMCNHNQCRMLHRTLHLPDDGHRDKRAKTE